MVSFGGIDVSKDGRCFDGIGVQSFGIAKKKVTGRSLCRKIEHRLKEVAGEKDGMTALALVGRCKDRFGGEGVKKFAEGGGLKQREIGGEDHGGGCLGR